MSAVDVYLEMDDTGRCMVHVPILPGCLVRERSREAALARLPDAIRAHLEWLRQHGERVDGFDEPIEPRIAGTRSGIGPFDPGDQATLFPWEKEVLSREEMDRTFRLAAHNRADLLALVRPLSRSVRNWEPGSEEMSIERALRHVGNSEQWYVSRVAAPETLPGQWADDEDMPVLRFLKMTRKTAETRLRQLSDGELGQVFYPTHFTEKPGEPWIARKVMRRFLEHEREHIDHISQILSQWRRHLMARVAGQRVNFLWPLLGVDHDALCQIPVNDGWTAKDLLAHVAEWDAVHRRRIEMIVDGRIAEIEPVGDAAAMDERNAEFYARNRKLSLDGALAMCMQEREKYLATLERTSDADLHRQIRMPWGWRSRMRVWAKWRHQHDATHARDLTRWRKRLPEERKGLGPRSILLANFKAAREEILALVALVPEADRARKALVGDWTLKDVIGHLADWEQAGVVWLRRILAGQAPDVDTLAANVDEFNRVKGAARKPQSWEKVWGDFTETRRELDVLVQRASGELLAETFRSPWGSDPTIYRWIALWPEHDLEHAVDLRRALGVSGRRRR